MNGPSLLLGVDGGGTKTIGIIADGDGRELARCQVGPSNPHVVGFESASSLIAGLISGCCAEANCAIEEVGTVVLGIAGAGGSEVQEELTRRVHAGLAREGRRPPLVVVESDARIALEGAFDGGPGALVIAGTGSVVLGKSADGMVRVVGGWGRLLGDEGSAYTIGRLAIRLVAHEFDCRQSPGLLGSMFREKFGWDTRERIILAAYQEDFPMSSLAPLVLDMAAAGDQPSLNILAQGATDLTAQLDTLVRLCDPSWRVGVVLSGGLISQETIYTRMLRDSITSALPMVEFREPLFTPVLGAVRMARTALQNAAP